VKFSDGSIKGGIFMSGVIYTSGAGGGTNNNNDHCVDFLIVAMNFHEKDGTPAGRRFFSEAAQPDDLIRQLRNILVEFLFFFSVQRKS
jgi:hypothetical protein